MLLSRDAGDEVKLEFAKSLHVLPFVKPEILHLQFDGAQISLQNLQGISGSLPCPLIKEFLLLGTTGTCVKLFGGIGPKTTGMNRLEEAAVAKTVAKEASSQAGELGEVKNYDPIWVQGEVGEIKNYDPIWVHGELGEVNNNDPIWV